MSNRYNFPLPFGWFHVAYSDELNSSEPKALHYFGQDLVLFRGDDGVPQVLDAYCPHLGAHLGEGGRVVGNTLECPFHAWRFDRQGKVAGIPYAKNTPPKARGKACLKAWPTVEKNQTVWVWYHPDNIAPMWEVEELDEAQPEAGWAPFIKHEWTIPTVLQEMGENAVDYAHFIYVHKVKSAPIAETEIDGHRSRRMLNADMETPRGLVPGGIESRNIGPGQSSVRFTGIAETLLMASITPIDNETLAARYAFTHPGEDGGAHSRVSKAIVADICKQMSEDLVIWQHKRYNAKPILCDGDGPIAQYRKWFGQFYPA